MPDADALHILGVVDVMLVMSTTAGLGLAHGARKFLLATDACIPHWIRHDVVTVLATHGA
jgi:hypothetical protein